MDTGKNSAIRRAYMEKQRLWHTLKPRWSGRQSGAVPAKLAAPRRGLDPVAPGPGRGAMGAVGLTLSEGPVKSRELHNSTLGPCT
jgi:hypothetical protein